MKNAKAKLTALRTAQLLSLSAAALFAPSVFAEKVTQVAANSFNPAAKSVTVADNTTVAANETSIGTGASSVDLPVSGSVLETTLPGSSPRKLSIPLSITTETNLKDPSDRGGPDGSNAFNSNLSVEITPQYKLTEDVTLTGDFAMSKDMTQSRNTTLNDGQIGGSLRPRRINGFLSWSFDNNYTLPLSKETRERNSLITSVIVRPNLIMDWGELGAKDLITIVRLGATRHIYKYTTTTTDQSNNQYVLTPRVDVIYQPLSWLALASVAKYSWAWTFGGHNVQKFSFTEEVDFQITSKTSFSVSYRNEGNAQKSDGFSNNVALFNSDAALIDVGVSYEF